MKAISYTLNRLISAGSAYGCCEVCGQPMETAYVLNRFKTYGYDRDLASDRAFRISGPLFGHRECLEKQTAAENPKPSRRLTLQ